MKFTTYLKPSGERFDVKFMFLNYCLQNDFLAVLSHHVLQNSNLLRLEEANLSGSLSLGVFKMSASTMISTVL